MYVLIVAPAIMYANLRRYYVDLRYEKYTFGWCDCICVYVRSDVYVCESNSRETKLVIFDA